MQYPAKAKLPCGNVPDYCFPWGIRVRTTRTLILSHRTVTRRKVGVCRTVVSLSFGRRVLQARNLVHNVQVKRWYSELLMLISMLQ
jgi:hypothetical protein